MGVLPAAPVLPADRAAGFAWGSNCVYVVIRRDDLRAGRLERARVVSGNG